MASRSSPMIRIESAIARFLLALPGWLLRLLGGRPIVRDGQTLDRQAQMLLRMMALRGVALGQRPLAEERRSMDEESAKLGPRINGKVETDDLTLAGAAGPRAARRYRNAGSKTAQPAVVYYHGGGFVLGGLDSHDAVCAALAHHAGCTVIALDYRLAPESPAPAAPKDAIAAYRDVAARAEELGVRADRLAVSGDSAGGNLAAVVAQQTRSDAQPPRAQVLFYPGVDFAVDHESKTLFAEGFLLDKTAMDWFSGHYVPDDYDRRDPMLSPIYGDLSGLAPAFVQTGGFDPLRDEGEAYAHAMQKAGVAVTLVRESTLFHGYLNVAGGIDRADAALRTAADYLREHLHA